ncbi:RNA polymerase sigma-70 factor [Sunxiuqinia sp. A32]|uniref:RNA polymerase sigma-70 factor n=1 Tax=Sunxiuqinia sp. A32 TaxID=3461496 RepID=UPI0040459A20
MNLSGKDIVRNIQSDDKNAFEELYRFLFKKLAYFSCQYLMDEEASDSIVQDAFTELWANRKSLQKDTNVHAWLFTVVKNKSLKQISKERSKRRYNDYIKIRQLDINYNSLSGFDTSNFVFEELQSNIDKALSKLSPSARIVFEKSRFEEKKNKEIAEELGISVKTVEGHMTKALKILREELSDYLPLLYLLFYLK